MKLYKHWLAAAGLLASVAVVVAVPVFAKQSQAKIHSGGLLKQSEGTVWYVGPRSLKRYRLPDAPADAFKLLKDTGMRVTKAVLEKVPTTDGATKPKTAKSTFGRFVYIDQDKTRLWYITPNGLRRYYFDGSAGSYQFLRSLAVSIAEADLNAIPTVEKQAAPAPTPEAKPTPAPQAAAETDCGTTQGFDLHCLVDAAKTCHAAKQVNTMTVDFIIKQTLTYTTKLAPGNDGKCKLYRRLEKNAVEFPAGTDAETVKTQTAMLQSLVGKDGTCAFTNQELDDLLSRWNKGSFGSDDTPSGKCTGPLYAMQMGGVTETAPSVPATPAPKPKPAPTTPAPASNTTVLISGFAFKPANIEIKAGSIVTWTNMDSAPHTATADDGTFGSPTLNQDGGFSAMLSKPGTYTYRCAFHPSMVGTITVR